MSVLWLQGHVPSIPAIPDEVLLERRQNLQPLKRIDKQLYYIEPISPSTQSLTFEATPAKALKAWREVARIETFHECGYIAMFKPSIDEVLRQVPEHIASEADCFEVLTGDTVACFSEGDGHRTVTVFYHDLSDEEQVVAELENMGCEITSEFPLAIKKKDGKLVCYAEAFALWREAKNRLKNMAAS